MKGLINISLSRAVLILAVLLSSSVVFATEETYSVRRDASYFDPGTNPGGFDIRIEDGRFSELLSSPNFVDADVKLRIKFGVDERAYYGYIGDYAALTTQITITPIANDGTPQPALPTQTLTVDYRADGMTNLYDFNTSILKHDGFHKYLIHVDPIVSIPDNVYIEAELTVDRYYEISTTTPTAVGCNYVVFDPVSGLESKTIDVSTGTALPAVGEIEVFWDYIEGAVEYELEWTWIDNYSTTNITSPLNTTMVFDESDFEKNNTRIITQDQNYRIPIIFSQGYLIYRVRGVGRWLDNSFNDVDIPKFGEWSSGTGVSTSGATVAAWPHFIQVSTEHEALKNWQYQAVYAEEGKKKEIISYFDGSLRNRQTVTRINSDHNSIVGESIYDNQGRAAIQILPAPVSNPALRYYEKLNVNPLGKPYSHRDFDWEDANSLICVTDVDGMSDVSGASKYYSDNNAIQNNWQDYVADASDYPFVQTEYAPDNTGRIRRQSGVGSDYTIDGDHATQYFYLQPHQEDLDRLFGYQVGFKTRYKKNLVVDANGQVSVSYIDPQGRVIATALAGNNTEGVDDYKTNLESLDEEQSGVHIMVDRDLLNKLGLNDVDDIQDDNQLYSSGNNGPENDGLQLNTQLGNTDDGNLHSFEYKLQTTEFVECGLSYPFAYQLTIDAKDDCGQSVLAGGQVDADGTISVLPAGSITETINTANSTNTYTFSALLDVGAYTVSKKIEVDPVLLDTYVQDYLANTTCLLTPEDFLVNNVDCDDDSLGNLGNLEITTCSVAHQMMLADISPYGQYGDVGGTDPLSVFSPINFLDKGALTTTSNWENPSIPYVDEFNNPALVVVTENVSAPGTYTPAIKSGATVTTIGVESFVSPEDLLNVADFVAEWEPSWAEALVPYHPEYCYEVSYGELCGTTGGSLSISSESYDASLQTITSYAAAKDPANALGFDLTAGSAIKTNDPYFNINYNYATINSLDGNTYKTALMDEIMSDYKRVNFPDPGLTLWDYAVKIAVCGSDFSGTCTIPAAFADGTRNLDAVPPAVAADEVLTEAQKDQIWAAYKQTYIAEKKKINQVFIDAYAISNGCYNGYIGEDAPNAPTVTGFMKYADYAVPTIGGIYNTAGIAGGPYYTTSPYMISFYLAAISAATTGTSSVPWATAVGASFFADKERRFIPIDNLYDASIPEEVMIANTSTTVDANIYSQTGRCDLSYDVEYLLTALAEESLFGDIQTGLGVSSDLIPGFTGDLYTEMGGTVVAPPGGSIVYVSATTTSSSITITANDASGTATSMKSITINKPSGVTWDWVDIKTFSTLYFIPSTTYQFEILAEIEVAPGVIEEVVLTGNTDIQIGDCVYPDPCPRAIGMTTEYELIIQHLFDNGQLFTDFTEGVTANVAAGWYTDSEIQTQLMDFGSAATFTNNSLGFFTITQGDLTITVDFGGYPTDILYIEGAIYDPVTGQLTLYYVNTAGETNDMLGNPINAVATVSFTDVTLPVPAQFDLDCDCNQELAFNTAFENLFNYLLTENATGTMGPSITTPFSELVAVGPYVNLPTLEIHGTQTAPTYLTSPTAFGFGWQKQGECGINFEHAAGSTGNLENLISVHNVQAIPIPGGFVTLFCDGLLSTGEVVHLEAVRQECLLMEDCEECIPMALQPQSCNEKWAVYDAQITAWNSTITDPSDQFPIYTEEEFCMTNHAYVTDAYLYFITTSGITSTEDDDYISIAQFGNTNLGHGFVNTATGDDLSDVVDDYFAYLVANPTIEITWSNYVNTVYLETEPGACPQPPLPSPIDITIEFPCEQLTANIDTVNAANQYGIYIENVIESFKSRYVEQAVASAVENFDVNYADKEYHYTLYYYDQAGNLIQTVPPAGVDRIEQVDIDQPTIDNIRSSSPTTTNPLTPDVLPAQGYQTKYGYNSLNQLVEQHTPDGGDSQFGYDELGRLVVSQNAKQKTEFAPNEQFSYTRYDGIGRIIEVGEMTLSAGYSFNEDGRFVNGGALVNVSSTNFPYDLSPINVEEVTITNYDEFPAISTVLETDFADFSVNNTRNRITAVMYFDNFVDGTTTLSDYANATFYDYDVHGNVKEIIQDIRDANLVALNQNLKKTKYEYDLVSGNVKEVAYQDEEADQFVHQYCYDSDNRITNVFTSKDRETWEQDAKYFYYEHGPLARTEIGDKKVQSSDMAYTIQGWLKGTNSEDLSVSNDQGHDGKLGDINRMNAKDVCGYSLHYYDGDYSSRTGVNAFLAYSTSVAATPDKDLFNGNIKQMYTASTNTQEVYIGTSHTWYGYDQLNRIKTMNQEELGGDDVDVLSGYSASYSYDSNGNLLTLTREVPTSVLGTNNIDDFTYSYITGTNRLDHVADATGDAGFDDLANQSAGNYDYTAIGELLSDAQEEIASIDWKVTGKVLRITRTAGSTKSDLEFTYDAMGNRVIKAEYDNAGNLLKKLYYIRDAQGNCMAIYSLSNDGVGDILELTERSVYGSSRVGLENVNQVIASYDGNQTINEENGIYSGINNVCVQRVGDKHYELSNHLGNVLEVITDRKLRKSDGYLFDLSTINTGANCTAANIWDSESVGTTLTSTDFDGNSVADLTVANSSSAYSGQLTFATVPGSTYTVSYEVLDQDVSINSVVYACPGGLLTPNMVTSTPGTYSYTFTATTSLSRVKWIGLAAGTYTLADIQITGDGDPTGGSGDEYICYTADVISQSDYYPFGMMLPQRQDQADVYRYSFNGMEKDDEVSGNNNSYDFGARLYNPRISRWCTIDPLARKFPSESPYSYVMNSPLRLIDPDGKAPKPPKKLYIVSQNNKSKSDNNSFWNAAYKVQQEEGNRNGFDGIEKRKAVNSGQDIVTYINSQGDNSIQSIDYFGHGGFSGTYFKETTVPNGPGPDDDQVIKGNLYKDPLVQSESENENNAHPIQKSVNITSINPLKFTDDARIELHGCAMAGESLTRNNDANLAISISKGLYDAGKKNAVVIAHVGAAGPYYPEWNGTDKYDDYRQNVRNVYWNGNLVYQTNKEGHIEQSTIDDAINNWKENSSTTIDAKDGTTITCIECGGGG